MAKYQHIIEDTNKSKNEEYYFLLTLIDKLLITYFNFINVINFYV